MHYGRRQSKAATRFLGWRILLDQQWPYEIHADADTNLKRSIRLWFMAIYDREGHLMVPCLANSTEIGVLRIKLPHETLAQDFANPADRLESEFLQSLLFWEPFIRILIKVHGEVVFPGDSMGEMRGELPITLVNCDPIRYLCILWRLPPPPRRYFHPQLIVSNYLSSLL